MLFLSKVENELEMQVVGNAWKRVETHWDDGLVLCGGIWCPKCECTRPREKWYGAVRRRGDRGPCIIELSGECYRMLDRAHLTEYAAQFKLRRRTRRERWQIAGSSHSDPNKCGVLVDSTAIEQAIFRLLDVPPMPESQTFNSWMWTVGRRRMASCLPGQSELPFDASLARADPSIYIV